MKGLSGFVLALAALAAARPALAADATDWSGAYIGGAGGFAWGNASYSFDGDGDSEGIFGIGQGSPNGEGSDGVFTHNVNGGFGGPFFGLDAPLWRELYLGFEAAYFRGNIYGQSSNPFVNPLYLGNDVYYKTTIDTVILAAPHLAWAWGPLLIRGGGGMAAARVENHLVSTHANGFGGGNFPGPLHYDASRGAIGWTCGGGVDYALGSRWTLGAELDYFDLGQIHFGGITTPSDAFWPMSYSVRPIIKAVSARLAYRFGFGTSGSGGAEPAAASREERPGRIDWTAPPEPSTESRVALQIRELASNDAKRRARAAVALGKIGSRDAVEPLIRALNDFAMPVRATAADALGKIDDRSAVNPVAALLRDPASQVRLLAARALGRLGDASVIPDLRRVAQYDADPKVREAAAAAVRSLSAQ